MVGEMFWFGAVLLETEDPNNLYLVTQLTPGYNVSVQISVSTM